MNSRSDQELLRSYAESGSEPAFSEIVRRHADFVYSVALRLVRDQQLAEDVSQRVFLALAANAARLSDRRFWPAGCTARHITFRPMPCAPMRDTEPVNEKPPP